MGRRVRTVATQPRGRDRVTPTYSVVIPTRNGAATLPALLDALRAQKTTGSLEVIAVDSGSTDGTIDLLQPQVHSLIRISPQEFDHGLTRNLAVARARGEFVVLLVQDALPAGNMFLESLAAPLVADARVAGTFARQQPRPEASAITRHYLDNWIASRAEARTSALVDGPAEIDAMTPMARLLFCAFDNVASCIRRSIWEQRPFKSTPIAEDLAWSLDVLLAGYSIGFAPDAVRDPLARSRRRVRVSTDASAPRAVVRAVWPSDDSSHPRADARHCHVVVVARPAGAAVARTVGASAHAGGGVATRTVRRRPSCRPPGRLANAASTGDRLMRILVVSHGFPPHAQGGAEIYAHEHALAFARTGDKVLVLTRESNPAREEYSVREERRHGLTIAWVNNTFAKTTSFADTYSNAGLRRVVAPIIEGFAPDVAHVHHLTCLSTEIVRDLAVIGIPVFFTLHDYWLICHRGQLLDRQLNVCSGPEPSGCGACLGSVAGVGDGIYAARSVLTTMERALPSAVTRPLRAAGAFVAGVQGRRQPRTRGVRGAHGPHARRGLSRDALLCTIPFHAGQIHCLRHRSRARHGVGVRTRGHAGRPPAEGRRCPAASRIPRQPDGVQGAAPVAGSCLGTAVGFRLHRAVRRAGGLSRRHELSRAAGAPAIAAARPDARQDRP